ncbi:hypothetical protein AB6A40_007832 [Gnathostoma spinigerum]|uniref:UV radiation resistance-associated gene protein n=1 Tax=Gnathostoma spinigerum TaxID=75299 RepID=A0ABD6EMN0_9BILA
MSWESELSDDFNSATNPATFIEPDVSVNESEEYTQSFSYSTWKRLRTVCQALQDTEVVADRKEKELQAVLDNDTEYRDMVASMQEKASSIRSLSSRIECAKCRVMTIRMKLQRAVEENETINKAIQNQRIGLAQLEIDAKNMRSELLMKGCDLKFVTSQVCLRRRKMLQDLMDIYQIDLEGTPENRFLHFPCACRPAITIGGAHLPDVYSLVGHQEIEVDAAIGYVVHMLLMLSSILNVSLRYPLVFFGSRSYVINPCSETTYPLYCTTRSRDKLEKAMDYVNRNIAQLRSDCGLRVRNVKKTLLNLQDLLLHLTCKEAELLFSRPSENMLSPASLLYSNKSEKLSMLAVDRQRRSSDDSYRSIKSDDLSSRLKISRSRWRFLPHMLSQS